jgi:hypothetical protein
VSAEDTAARMIGAFQSAMADEGIPAETIEHVINRLVYGDPHGPRARAGEVRESGQRITIHMNGDPVMAAAAVRREAERAYASPPRCRCIVSPL